MTVQSTQTAEYPMLFLCFLLSLDVGHVEPLAGKSVFSDNYGPVHGPWKNISGAVAHVWRRAHWSNWMFEVDSYDSQQDTIHWTRGGFQVGHADDYTAMQTLVMHQDNTTIILY